MNPIPYGRQNITQDDIDAVVEAIQAPFLTQGPKIQEFEDRFAEYVDAKYAVAVSNATAGLHLAVMALDLQKGDRVITSPITFAASANCVRYVGGEVWFADIDRETYLLSLESTRALIESHPKGFFKGIIPVDFGGLSVPMEDFRALANEHDLWIIEDACHAPGGYFTNSAGEQVKCGQSRYSDVSVFSFHPVKHIACGEGGMVTTNDPALAKSLQKLRTHGISKDNMAENHGGWYYEMQELGYNYRLTDIQSSLGLTQLKKNKEGVVRRNEIAQKYMDAFLGKIAFQQVPEGYYHAYHLFIIEVEDRLGLYNHLREKAIYAQIHYIPVHTLPYYKAIGYQGADLKHSEDYYSKCISLPMFPTLTEEEQDFVIQTVLDFVNG